MLTISIVEMTVIIRLMISTVDVEVIKEIKKVMRSVEASIAMKDSIFIVIIATYLEILLRKSLEQH